MMRSCAWFMAILSLFTIPRGLAAEAADDLVRGALAAEAKLETRRALELFLEAEKSRPNDAFVLQKIARQYSDLAVDLPTVAEKKASIERALAYSQRSVAADPKNPENVLSVAVCHGKLAVYSDTRRKVEYSRIVREHADRALALDPKYAWAHHLLGRWHYEISDLGTTARVFVRIFYGGLPAASTGDAVKHLEQAVALEPQQLQHRLELGFAYLADKKPDKARAAFEAGLAMPSREKHDDPAKERARAALAKLKAT
jgi:tetratricopeptide (TPR) repeat protein